LSKQKGRLSVLLEKIDEWMEVDPDLEDKAGFLRHYEECNPGQFPVPYTETWIKYYKQAKKKGITVAELLFEKRRTLLSKRTEKRPTGTKPKEIFVIDEEQRRELEEMDDRLKLTDPARVKRLNK
jgi:hypothetical protein